MAGIKNPMTLFIGGGMSGIGKALAQSLEATDADLAHAPTLSEAMHEAGLDACGNALSP